MLMTGVECKTYHLPRSKSLYSHMKCTRKCTEHVILPAHETTKSAYVNKQIDCFIGMLCTPALHVTFLSRCYCKVNSIVYLVPISSSAYQYFRPSIKGQA